MEWKPFPAAAPIPSDLIFFLKEAFAYSYCIFSFLESMKLNWKLLSESHGSGAVFQSEVNLASLPDAIDWRENVSKIEISKKCDTSKQNAIQSTAR